jgi:hypothetical protein
LQGVISSLLDSLKLQMIHQFATQLQKYSIPLIFLSILLVGCKSLDISNPGPLPEIPPATSEVNVPLTMPKATLNKIFNSQLPVNLVSEENLDLGSGIEGNLQLSRVGNISWVALDSQTIQMTLPLKVKGDLGLKRGGLGSLFRGKVPLDEQFAPVFRVNPQINPDWSLSVKQFELMDLGGNFALDVLGMKLDLSGLLEREIRAWAKENLRPEQKLVNMKPMIDLAWEQAGKPFMVNWEGGAQAFSIQPQSVRLKEYFDQSENFHLWLGLNGKINTHPANAAPSRAFPLPALSTNSDSENHLEITLPFQMSYAELDALMAENFLGKTFRADRKTLLTLANLKTQSFGERLAITCDFVADRENGERMEGNFFVVGKPAYDRKSESLIFEDVNFKVMSDNSRAKLGIALKKGKIIRQIEKRAVFPIGDLLEDSLGGIQERLGLETPIANLSIQNLEISPSGFYPTRSGLQVMMKAQGKIGVNWK